MRTSKVGIIQANPRRPRCTLYPKSVSVGTIIDLSDKLSKPKTDIKKNFALSPDAITTDNPPGVFVKFAKAVANRVLKPLNSGDLSAEVVKAQAQIEALTGQKLSDRIHTLYLPEQNKMVLVADNLAPGKVAQRLRSPVIDLFNGEVIPRSMSERPVMKMVGKALRRLESGERTDLIPGSGLAVSDGKLPANTESA